jgi:hypothetical protein
LNVFRGERNGAANRTVGIIASLVSVDPREVLGAWLLSALLFAMMSFFSRAKAAVPPKDPAPADANQTAPAQPAAAETGEVAAKISAVRGLAADLPVCTRMPLDDACIIRYLRARGMDVAKAGAMLRATIEWRHSFGVDNITSQLALVKAEGVTGKTFVAPFVDREGRVVFVLRPRNENTRTHTGNIVNLVYSLERISALIRQGRPSKLLLIIDFKGYSMMNAPPMKTSMETLNILQNQCVAYRASARPARLALDPRHDAHARTLRVPPSRAPQLPRAPRQGRAPRCADAFLCSVPGNPALHRPCHTR